LNRKAFHPAPKGQGVSDRGYVSVQEFGSRLFTARTACAASKDAAGRQGRGTK